MADPITLPDDKITSENTDGTDTPTDARPEGEERWTPKVPDDNDQKPNDEKPTLVVQVTEDGDETYVEKVKIDGNVETVIIVIEKPDGTKEPTVSLCLVVGKHTSI